MSMPRTLSVLALLAGTAGTTAAQSVYYPPLVGNTWESIAQRHGMTVDKLRRLNPQRAEALAPGEVLDVWTDAGQLPERGTSVTTSGIDVASFPASIPVGKVRSVNESSGGLSIELEVRPMADIDRLAFLTVLLWEPPP